MSETAQAGILTEPRTEESIVVMDVIPFGAAAGATALAGIELIESEKRPVKTLKTSFENSGECDDLG